MSFYPIRLHAEFSLWATQQTDDNFHIGELEDCLLQGWNMTPSEEDPDRWTGDIDLSMKADEGGDWQSRVAKILQLTPAAVMEIQEVEISNLEVSIDQAEVSRLAEEVAADLHQAWQDENREIYQVRRKATGDEEWIAKAMENAETLVLTVEQEADLDADKLDLDLEPGQALVLVSQSGERLGVYVDIMNTEYQGLPQDWQEANLVSAQGAAELITQSILENGSWDMETVAAAIHEQWLQENSWAKDSEQGKPFEELSEADQERDRSVARVVAKHL